MLKRLLIVIFVLQSFAFNALASTNMSQLNQAEIAKMQIMHQVAEKNTSPMNHVNCSMDASQNNPPLTTVNYCNCDHEGNCHSLLCNSIHASNPIDSKAPYLFSVTLFSSNPVITLSSALSHAYYPPETPPPLV